MLHAVEPSPIVHLALPYIYFTRIYVWLVALEEPISPPVVLLASLVLTPIASIALRHLVLNVLHHTIYTLDSA